MWIKLPTLALKPGGDITRSPKQGCHWLHTSNMKTFLYGEVNSGKISILEGLQITKNKRQTSKKIFVFVSAFTQYEWVFLCHTSCFDKSNIYRPRSEASEGYVFTGVCHSVTGMLYSGKQTDATAIDFQPIGDRLTNELRDFKVQWRLSVYHYGRAVCILLECILVCYASIF